MRKRQKNKKIPKFLRVIVSTLGLLIIGAIALVIELIRSFLTLLLQIGQKISKWVGQKGARYATGHSLGWSMAKRGGYLAATAGGDHRIGGDMHRMAVHTQEETFEIGER